MTKTKSQSKRIVTSPAVQLFGDVNHPDFRAAICLLRTEARLVTSASERPELIIIAQSRPGLVATQQVGALRRAAPLAGIVALLGSWCEGETRTGRPWPGIERLYWYEFPTWWQGQQALRAMGQCPNWLRPEGSRCRVSVGNSSPRQIGVVVLQSRDRETANALIDVLHRAGYATVWRRGSWSSLTVRGAMAGIWDGGQLTDGEATDLSTFCRQLSNDAAPVVGLLDFPRRDRVARAHEAGVAAVLGKPWFNCNLIGQLQKAIADKKMRRAA